MSAKEILSKSGAKKGIKFYTINSRSVKGEPGTGYEEEDGLGPFECGNCEYFRESDSSCGQKDMKRVSKQPRTRDGRVKVDESGCCDYIDRIGDGGKKQ